jgi:hypothetical protein
MSVGVTSMFRIISAVQRFSAENEILRLAIYQQDLCFLETDI